jgi:WD40 repeat protein
LEDKTRQQGVWKVPAPRARDRSALRDIELITHETDRPQLKIDFNELQRTQLSPDGSKLARLISVDAEKDRPARIELWDVAERKARVTLEKDFLYAKWSDDAGMLATIDADGKVEIWSAADGSLVGTISSSKDNPATAAVFGPADQIFVLDDQGIIVWNVNTGARLKVFPRRCKTIAIGPVENQCALIDDEDRCMMLNLETGALSSPIQIEPSEHYALAFSPDGKYLACGSSSDREIRILEVAKNGIVEKLSLSGHYEGIRDLAFLSNGKRLVSGSMDNTAKVWDWENRAELLTFRGHESPVVQVVVSFEDSCILSLDEAHNVRQWHSMSSTPQPRKNSE